MKGWNVGVVGGKDDLGLGIIWYPPSELALDESVELFGTFVGKNGALLARTMGALDNCLNTYVQIDGDTVSVDPLHVVEIAGCAPASADDGIVHGFSTLEHESFQFAEGLFAVATEKDGNRGMVSLLEELVKVDKPCPQSARQLVPNSGLATIHISEEINFQLIMND